MQRYSKAIYSSVLLSSFALPTPLRPGRRPPIRWKFKEGQSLNYVWNGARKAK